MSYRPLLPTWLSIWRLTWPVSLVLALVLALLAPLPIPASSYYVPPDQDITCFSLELGRMAWQGTGDSLGFPVFRMVDSFVVARSKEFRATRTVARNLRTGKTAPIEGRLADTALDASEHQALDSLDLTRDIRLRFRSGDTKDLIHLGAKGDTLLLRKLHDFPSSMQAKDSVVYLAFSERSAERVFAWQPFRNSLVWAFSPQAHERSIPDWASSDLALDGAFLLVSCHQFLFKVDRKNGRLVWKTALPSQAIRPYDKPWTRFWKYRGKYILACYDRYFVLDPRQGRLLHSMDPGTFSNREIAAKDGLVCYGARKGGAQALQAIPDAQSPAQSDSLASVVRIAWPGESADSMELSLLRFADVPKGAEVLLPFVDADRGQGEYQVRMGTADSRISIRFSRPKASPRSRGKAHVYVGLNRWTGKVEVKRGEKTVEMLKLSGR